MKTGLAWLAYARKALIAAVVAAGPLLIAAFQGASPNGTNLTGAEIGVVATTALVAFLGVYNVGNGTKPGTTTVTVDTAPGAVAEGDAKLTQPRVDQ